MNNTITVYEFDVKDRTHHYLDAVQVSANAKLQGNQTTVAPADGSQFFNGKEWVSELARAFHYDENGYFDYFSIVPKGSELEANETTVVPYDANGAGMYKPKFDAMQNAWVETLSKEEIEALNKPADPKPNSDDQAVSMLTAQLLQTQMTVKQQGTQIASLTSALLANAKGTN